ncbi:MAG TPA: hypothetical protein VGH99_10795 [Pseudonocardia sp.]
MFKKVIVVTAAAAAALVAAAGVAYADSGSPRCDAHESTHQTSKHNLLGPNVDVNRITGGVLVGQIDKVPGICPSVGNNNDLG